MDIFSDIIVVLGVSVFLLGLYLLLFERKTITYLDGIIVGTVALHGFFELCFACSNGDFIQTYSYLFHYQFVYPSFTLLLFFIRRKYIGFALLITILAFVSGVILFEEYFFNLYNSDVDYLFVILFILASIGCSIIAFYEKQRSGIKNYILLFIGWLFIADLVNILTFKQIIKFNINIWQGYFIYFLVFVALLRFIIILYYGRRIFKKSLAISN
jgi:hypothetical protein